MQLNLETLLRYKNDRLLQRYEEDYPDAKLKAEEALSEFLKFVWLCHEHSHDKLLKPRSKKLNFACAIYAEMAEIDYMWHTFLLFTRDYHAFCSEYLRGDFFHHEPATHEEAIDKNKFKAELTNYLSYIYEKLGDKTLRQWFGD